MGDTDHQDLQAKFEASERSASFIASLLRTKRRRLLVYFVVLGAISLLNPLKGPVSEYGGLWFSAGWGVVCLIVIFLIIREVRRLPRPVDYSLITQPVGARGLYPFEGQDSEIFKRLGRIDLIRQVSSRISSSQLRFGMIFGDTGSGKTSLLLAGIIPVLSDRFAVTYINSYAKTFNESILPATQPPPREGPTKPRLIFLDQVEQIFSPAHSRGKRRLFVRAVKTHLSDDPSSKVVFCVRDDFVGKVIALLDEAGFDRGLQHDFAVEKFEPEQALQVLIEIAKSDAIALDERFVENTLVPSLADSDGLISPINIQIFSWMITRLNGTERAMTAPVFNRLGGVDGLMERYVRKALTTVPDHRSQPEIVTILLSLVNLETETKKEPQSLAELSKANAQSFTSKDTERLVSWFARNDVRLVVKSESDAASKYELAHEKIIPALRRISGNEVPEATKARLLLNQRVNEWIGNARKRKYLLSVRDYYAIKKNETRLDFSSQSTEKKDLIAKSLRRFVAYILLLSVLPITAISYNVWRTSRYGQIYTLKKRLVEIQLRNVGEPESLVSSSIAFAAIGERQLAFAGAEHTPPPRRSDTYSMIAMVLAQRQDQAGATEACRIAWNDKTRIGYHVVENCLNVAVVTQNSEFLEELTRKIVTVVEGRPRLVGDAIVLGLAVETFYAIGKPERGAVYAQMLLQWIESGRDRFDKLYTLKATNRAFAVAGQLDQYRRLVESLREPPTQGGKASLNSYDATAADLYGEIGDTSKAIELLDSIYQRTDNINYLDISGLIPQYIRLKNYQRANLTINRILIDESVAPRDKFGATHFLDFWRLTLSGYTSQLQFSLDKAEQQWRTLGADARKDALINATLAPYYALLGKTEQALERSNSAIAYLNSANDSQGEDRDHVESAIIEQCMYNAYITLDSKLALSLISVVEHRSGVGDTFAPRITVADYSSYDLIDILLLIGKSKNNIALFQSARQVARNHSLLEPLLATAEAYLSAGYPRECDNIMDEAELLVQVPDSNSKEDIAYNSVQRNTLSSVFAQRGKLRRAADLVQSGDYSAQIVGYSNILIIDAVQHNPKLSFLLYQLPALWRPNAEISRWQFMHSDDRNIGKVSP